MHTPDQNSSATREVHFTYSPPHVFDILPMTQAEKSHAWYSKNELQGFKKRARSISSMKKFEVGNMCFRGLEHRTSIPRAKAKKYAIWAVLEVQKRLRRRLVDTPMDDVVALAVVAQKLTLPARNLASSTGSDDALEAYQVYRSPNVSHISRQNPLFAGQPMHTSKSEANTSQSPKPGKGENIFSFERTGI